MGCKALTLSADRQEGSGWRGVDEEAWSRSHFAKSNQGFYTDLGLRIAG